MSVTTINPQPGETWLVDRGGSTPEEVIVVSRYPHRVLTMREGEAKMQLRYTRSCVRRATND